MAYKLLWTRRIEQGVVYSRGDIVDLAHYTPEEIAELLAASQYQEVPDEKPKAKEVKANG